MEKELDELKFCLGIPGKEALAIIGIRDLDRVLLRWEDNLRILSKEVELFKHIDEVVKELKDRNIKLGIITSKRRKEFDEDFKKYNIEDYFDLTICADDTINHKPHKEPMEKYLELSGANKDHTIYIGDSIYDMQCAKNAGVDGALALWGAPSADISEATYKVKTPFEILELISSLSCDSI